MIDRISKLAHVSKEAKLHKSVEVGPFAYISNDVEIDEGTVIMPNAVIMDGARIGKNCKIFPGAVVSAVPQDLKYKGEKTHTIIGDNNVIRECVTINKGTIAEGKTVIGNNNLIMAYCHVAHDCIIGNDCVLANSVGLSGHVEIEDMAIVGGMSGILQFSRIGKLSIIGGGSMINKDILPYSKVAKSPITFFGPNRIGLRRKGFSPEKIEEVKVIFDIFYLQNRSIESALNFINESYPNSDLAKELIEFNKKSKNGLLTRVGSKSEEKDFQL